MELLLLLLAAHFIGDFYLQPSRWVECRNDNHIKSIGLWKHFLVHTLLNTAVFLISDLSFIQSIISIGFISISHLLTDYWKSHRKKNFTYFLVDQIIHILIINIVWAYLAGFTFEQVATFIGKFFTAKNMIIAISYVLVCKPASVIISLALKKHTDSLIKDNETAKASTTLEVHEISDDKVAVTIVKKGAEIQSTDVSSNDKNQDVGLVSAGSWIGYIERCLAISFIFIGQFAGIGFLVATKTIFRFGDLTKNKDMKLTEYMMLGTLLSYAIAFFIGWNALQIYKAI